MRSSRWASALDCGLKIDHAGHRRARAAGRTFGGIDQLVAALCVPEVANADLYACLDDLPERVEFMRHQPAADFRGVGQQQRVSEQSP